MLNEILSKDLDRRLQAFLDAETEKEATHCLENLLHTTVRPIVSGVLRHKLGVAVSFQANSRHLQTHSEADADELYQEVLIRVTAALYQLRKDRSLPPISDLAGFSATTAYHAINLYYRKCYPKRTSLTNKLRYLLNSRPEFCRWLTDEGESLAGYRRWQEQIWDVGSWNCLNGAARFRRENGISQEELQVSVKLVASIFDWLRHPIRFNDLVTMLADLCVIQDYPPQPLPAEGASGALAVVQIPFTEEIDSRVTLRRYWTALCTLPPNQRCCLLLQADDPAGNSLIHMLHVYGVASLEEIAEAVVMPIEMLKTIYSELPWEDKTIATKLNTTPLYVTRLRGMARKRLGQTIQTDERTRPDG